MRTSWPIRTPLLWSIAFGAGFGLFIRVLAAFHWFPAARVGGIDVTAVMSLSYLVLGSAAVGYVTVWCAEIKGQRPVWQWIVVPWCAVLVSMIGAALFLLEGAICLLFALPMVMLFSSAGGVAAGVIRRRARPAISTHLFILVLPLILPHLETRFPAPLQIRTVHSEVRIAAPPSTVWKYIAGVSRIGPEELPATWTERIGFPRPIAATLSYEGVGGVRQATFERGLCFIETVTVWQPGRQLSFTIKADTAHIPPATLDTHATIGGAYFDVLSGDYRIQALDANTVILHLTSRERLTTDFNSYAGFWTDAVMRSIQQSILQVIRHRCEIAR